MYTNNLGVHN